MDRICFFTKTVMKADYPDQWETMLDACTSTDFPFYEQVCEAIEGRTEVNGLKMVSWHSPEEPWYYGLVLVYAL